MPLIADWSEAQYVAMVAKLLSSCCGKHLVDLYCKESNRSDSNWMKYLSLSYLIKIWFSLMLPAASSFVK